MGFNYSAYFFYLHRPALTYISSSFQTIKRFHGIPCCSNDTSLLLKKEGNNTALLKNGIARQKFICPMTTWDQCEDGKYRRIWHCANPCTSSVSGRMVYIYLEKNLCAYPGVLRGTEDWDNTYKIRTVIKRDINHIKENLCLSGRRTQNEKSIV